MAFDAPEIVTGVAMPNDEGTSATRDSKPEAECAGPMSTATSPGRPCARQMQSESLDESFATPRPTCTPVSEVISSDDVTEQAERAFDDEFDERHAPRKTSAAHAAMSEKRRKDTAAR